MGLAYAGAAPLWSADGQHVCFVTAREPVQRNLALDNQTGIDCYGMMAAQTTVIVAPGEIGTALIELWALSSDRGNLVFTNAGGTWWVRISR